MDATDPMVNHQEQDRRQFRRFAMSLAVQARRDDLGGQPAEPVEPRPEQTVSIEIQNFSLGGFRGRSALALRRDERLTLFVPPFGTRPAIDVTGRVVRCDRQDDRFDVGIEFCQTAAAPESSPWLRLPELFYMAGETSKEIQ